MDVKAPRGLLRALNEVPDPRMDRTKRHSLQDILAIAICAVISGAEGWTHVALFGRSKIKWFKTFLTLPNGIPSHDTFGRVFAKLDPMAFEEFFMKWITALATASKGRLIAIDGKAIRRSLDTANGKAAIHMVSAWCEANHMVLGQVATDAKSNEITAIPKLLEMLELSNSLVTIDAMGCQTAIARQIVKAEADYVLAVKGNQPTLHQGIVDFFNDHLEDDFARTKVRRYETREKGHGRDEHRYYFICPVPADLPDRSRWPQLKAIGIVLSHTQRDGKECTEVRYYILSKYLSGRRFARAVRDHWGIENRLHWQLDVTFQEDQCRLRKGHADANFSILRRTALSLLKNESALKVGIKNKRLTAGWDETYLEKVLVG